VIAITDEQRPVLVEHAPRREHAQQSPSHATGAPR
jgi:hypothetical protein